MSGIWAWVWVCLALGISSLPIAVGFIFVKTLARRIVMCLTMPIGTAILLTIISTLITGDGFGACLSFGFTLIFAYLSVPVGLILRVLYNLVIAAVTPYEPYKPDKKTKLKL